jgi:Arc/MetJ-type ribon-helix-helix transcriptional regulator
LNKQYQNKEWLKQEYITKDRMLREIANQCQISTRTVLSYLNEFKLHKYNREMEREGMRVLTVNVPESYIPAINKLVGTVYPSRSEFIRHAVKMYLMKVMKELRELRDAPKKPLNPDMVLVEGKEYKVIRVME